MGQSCWDVGEAEAWSTPGALPIPTCSGFPKGPWGQGTVWDRGTGRERVLSSLNQPVGTLSLFACSKGLWSNMAAGQWLWGWKGRCGSLLYLPRPRQPRSRLPLWRHRTFLIGKGCCGEPGSRDKMGQKYIISQ